MNMTPEQRQKYKQLRREGYSHGTALNSVGINTWSFRSPLDNISTSVRMTRSPAKSKKKKNGKKARNEKTTKLAILPFYRRKKHKKRRDHFKPKTHGIPTMGLLSMNRIQGKNYMLWGILLIILSFIMFLVAGNVSGIGTLAIILFIVGLVVGLYGRIIHWYWNA